MTLDEAIKILTIHNDHNPNFTDAERRDAHKLGIEALKRIRYTRSCSSLQGTPLLPGETSPKPLHALGLNTGDDESP